MNGDTVATLAAHPVTPAGLRRAIGAAVAATLLVAGCAGAKRPVLYPNAQYERVGRSVAETAVEDCMRRAEEFGARPNKRDEIITDTAAGAAIGGASAGAWGLVRGDSGERALAGAAAGGAAGLVRGGLKSGEPSSTFKNFVQKCLRDRGYEVVGWE